MRSKSIIYLFLGSLFASLLLMLLSLAQKLMIDVPITAPQGYIVPLVFGAITGCFVTWLMLKQRRLFRERLDLQFQTQQELEKANVMLTQEVAERKTAEQTALTQEFRLRSLINAIPDFILLIDSQGRLDVSNKPARTLFTLSDNDYPNQEFLPRQSQFLDKALRESGMNQEAFWKSRHMITAYAVTFPGDETRTTFDITRVPLVNEDGGDKGDVLLGRNVTSAVRVQDELRRYAEFSKLLLDSVGQGVYGVDLTGSVTFYNPAAVRLTGFSENDLLGENQHSILHHTRPDGTPYPFEDCPITLTLLTGATHRIDDDIFWNAEGASFPVEFISAPIMEGNEIAGAVVVFNDITLRKETEQTLTHRAYHDALTGLPNRALFMERLDTTLRHYLDNPGRCAMLFIDLENFKNINDNYGHQAGDELLRHFARRLINLAGEHALVARLGGDEFGILIEKIEHNADAITLAYEIHRSLKSAFQLRRYLVETAAAIGVVCSSVEHTTPDRMLRDADIAMYQAKAKGRNQCEVFDMELHYKVVQRIQLERALSQGIERGEFIVHYQPIFAMESCELAGFEALIRWERPGHGLVPPGCFITVAEETGMILPIGEFVLSESCRQMRLWLDRYPSLGHLTISVNLSAKQLLTVDVVSLVRNMLEKSRLPPANLKLELTESMLLDEMDLAKDYLETLQFLGVAAVLDDFGTGYSSLSHLRNFPLEAVKVDRSFVWRMTESSRDQAIVGNLINLAHILGLRVTAEGVEDEATLMRLVGYGCDLAQGFYMAHPLAAKEIEQLLAQEASSLEWT